MSDLRSRFACPECGGSGVDKPADCVCAVFRDTGGFRIADPNCPHCHGTGAAGGHWLGDRWCDHEHTWHFCSCSEEG